VRESDALSRRVGYLSQRFSLYGDLSVDENIAFFAEVHGVRGWAPRRDELLDLLRMTPFRSRLADRLSGGMKQKLALACTLVHTPDLLVLDEPTTGVDPVSRRDFWRILARLQREGLTLLVTTPYLDEAERCQRVALMDHARGVIVEVLAHPKRDAAALLEARPGVADVQVFGERLHATLPDVAGSAAPQTTAAIVAELSSAGVRVEAARALPPSLEDIFIARIRSASSGLREEARS
jgi:ABC-2 type transport system ATP-binding protein